MLNRAVGTLIATVGLAACLHLESTAPPERPQFVVHAVIDPTTDQQFVLVYQARTGAATAVTNTHDTPVANAVVTVTAPNSAVMIADERASNSSPFPPGTYAYTPARYGVRPASGGTYRLFVRTPSGQEVTGETTIPVAPAMSSRLPSARFDRYRDTLRLSWPAAARGTSYELVIKTYQDEYRTFFDSSIVVPGTALTITGNPVFLPGDVTIMVSAVDENYYAYYRSQNDPFAGTPPDHLTGAVGVFGSIAPLLNTELLVR